MARPVIDPNDLEEIEYYRDHPLYMTNWDMLKQRERDVERMKKNLKKKLDK